MTIRFADRAFLSLNGTKLFDIESSSLHRNKNRREVASMTNDGYNRGFVEGNWTNDISAVMAVQNSLARPKLEGINYESNDVQLTYICGADQYVCKGLFLKDVNDDAGGVGQEAKATFNFGCLKVIDNVGNSVLFPIDLT